MDIRRRRFLGASAWTAAVTTVAGTATACAGDARAPAASRATAPARPTATARPTAAAPAGTSGTPARHLSGEIVHGPRKYRQVALTFHGAGDPAVARRLLAAAAAAGARITVLAVGNWLDAHPEMAQLILDGGHELGNHTQHHADINAMTPAAAHAEIAQCAERLRKLTGTIGTWFRPSRTPHANMMVRTQAAKVGYHSCLSYDVDSRDFQDPGPDAIIRNVLRGVRGGSIVSMHFGHQGTVTAMPALLDGLRRRGLRAVTVSSLLSA
ncbi:MAG TPA: polysaccharide deacetylase family protein [Streptosporangiaceae bacterium]